MSPTDCCHCWPEPSRQIKTVHLPMEHPLSKALKPWPAPAERNTDMIGEPDRLQIPVQAPIHNRLMASSCKDRENLPAPRLLFSNRAWPLTSLCFSRWRYCIINNLSSHTLINATFSRYVTATIAAVAEAPSWTSDFFSKYVIYFVKSHSLWIFTCLFATENFSASGGSLASQRGCDKLFKKPFIFHFNQSKSTLIKKKFIVNYSTFTGDFPFPIIR